MRCRSCQQLLSELIDGDLPPRKARAVAEHADACLVCSAVRDDLMALRDRLRGLECEDWAVGPTALGEPAGAPDAAWARIEAALDADEAQVRRAARQSRRRSWLVPAAATAILGAVGAGAAVRARRGGAESGVPDDRALLHEAHEVLAGAEARYATATRELEQMIAADAPRPSTRPRHRLERAAREVNAKVREREAEVAARPRDFEAAEALLDAWRERVGTLEEAAIPSALEAGEGGPARLANALWNADGDPTGDR